MKNSFSKLKILLKRKLPEEELSPEDKIRLKKIESKVRRLPEEEKKFYEELLRRQIGNSSWCRNYGISYSHCSKRDMLRAKEIVLQQYSSYMGI